MDIKRRWKKEEDEYILNNYHSHEDCKRLGEHLHRSRLAVSVRYKRLVGKSLLVTEDCPVMMDSCSSPSSVFNRQIEAVASGTNFASEFTSAVNAMALFCRDIRDLQKVKIRIQVTADE